MRIDIVWYLRASKAFVIFFVSIFDLIKLTPLYVNTKYLKLSKAFCISFESRAVRLPLIDSSWLCFRVICALIDLITAFSVYCWCHMVA